MDRVVRLSDGATPLGRFETPIGIAREQHDPALIGHEHAILGIAPTGFEIDWNKVIFKMLTLKGIYGREMFETWYKMASLIQSGLDLSPIITHRFDIDDFQQGFDAMRSGQSGKVILRWDK